MSRVVKRREPFTGRSKPFAVHWLRPTGQYSSWSVSSSQCVYMQVKSFATQKAGDDVAADNPLEGQK